jgi:hypothetical protein
MIGKDGRSVSDSFNIVEEEKSNPDLMEQMKGEITL